jgi:hypothetical protein
MMYTAKTKLAQGESSRTIAIGLRLTLAVVSLCFIASAVASAQTMGSSATYSDAWVHSYEDDNAFVTPTVTVIGCGVTQDNNNTYSHSYWAVTTLRSPSGRTASATSSRTNSYSAYTRAETSLSWDWNSPETGNYQVQTQHWMCCPYMSQYGGGCFPSSSTSYVFPIGIRKDAYEFLSETFVGGRYGHGIVEYEPICNGTCTVYPTLYAHKLYPGTSPDYAQCSTLYIFTCIQITKFCYATTTPGTCD